MVDQPEGVSASGVASLQKEEGTVLRVYKDVAGIDTVCTGHVKRPEDASWIADGVSMIECRMILGKDLHWVADTIHLLVKIPLLAQHFDMIASLIFNIGPHGFAGSTVLKKLNDGDLLGAADAFLLWAFASVGGVKTPVLLGRRKRERETFLTGKYSVEVDASEWLELRDSGKTIEVVELTEAEENELMAEVAVSLREEGWREMEESWHRRTEPPPGGGPVA